MSDDRQMNPYEIVRLVDALGRADIPEAVRDLIVVRLPIEAWDRFRQAVHSYMWSVEDKPFTRCRFYGIRVEVEL